MPVMSKDQCPTSDQLTSYVRGTMLESGAVEISSHVETCSNCQRKVDTLVGRSDSLIAPLRQRDGLGQQANGNVERLVAQAVGGTGKAGPRSGGADSATKPVEIEVFIAALRKSELLEETEIDSLLESIDAETVQQLARELIKRGKLTRYQAGALARGKSKGLILGKYELLDKIGQGGMGIVFRARHRHMGREVAVKILPPSATKSPDALQRFQREVRTAAQLNHENIVIAYDADQDSGVHFLVMEFVDGADLGQVVKRNGPLPVDQAVECVLQSARGLEYAHGRGVVHRDIKPSNLLLGRNGKVKILDLGLARLDDSFAGNNEADRAELTSTGTVMGTIDYMSPEQALNSKHADNRSDIYSLGCTLHFLLTRKAAFSGDTIMEKLVAHREQPAPSLAEDRSEIPAGLDAIFQRMVAKKPDQRYQSMGELMADLQTIASGDGVPMAQALLADSVKTPTAVVDLGDSISGLGATEQIPQDAKETLVNPPSIPPRPSVLAQPAPIAPQRRAKLPVWRNKNVVVGASIAGGVIVLGLVVLLVVKTFSDDGDPNVAKPDGDSKSPSIGQSSLSSGSSGKKNPFATPTNNSQDRILLVLSQKGFWDDDYDGIVQACKNRGIELTLASAYGGEAKSSKGRSVKTQKSLDEVNMDKYDAIVFAGGDVSQYKSGGSHFAKAKNLVHQAKDVKRGKVVASICTGDEVLIDTGIMYGKNVARCDASTYTPGSGIKLMDNPVSFDGNIITSGHAKHADPFVEKIAWKIQALRNAKD
jgi:serine/threonine protein kinase